MTRDDETRIEEIRAWFDERGYELVIHEVADGWRAPYIRKSSRIGSADYGVGKTRLEAAEDAKARYAKDPVDGPRVIEKTGSLVAGGSLGGTTETQTIHPPSIVSDRALGTPTVDSKPVDIEQKIKTLTGYGWRLWFEPQPDGKVMGVLLTYESGEVLKTVLGSDNEDAWLALGIDTYPPSDEVRTERNRRDES